MSNNDLAIMPAAILAEIRREAQRRSQVFKHLPRRDDRHPLCSDNYELSKDGKVMEIYWDGVRQIVGISVSGGGELEYELSQGIGFFAKDICSKLDGWINEGP